MTSITSLAWCWYWKRSLSRKDKDQRPHRFCDTGIQADDESIAAYSEQEKQSRFLPGPSHLLITAFITALPTLLARFRSLFRIPGEMAGIVVSSASHLPILQASSTALVRVVFIERKGKICRSMKAASLRRVVSTELHSYRPRLSRRVGLPEVEIFFFGKPCYSVIKTVAPVSDRVTTA